MPQLDASRTALVVIDPQNWTMGMPLAPNSADTILANLVRLAHALRASGGIVCTTRAAFSAGYADMLRVPVDVTLTLPDGGIPVDKLAFRPEIEALGAEITVTKRQWSAFYGTELDLQLRRRNMTTIVLGGVMTNFGVESTARDAWQHNYAVVIAEDGCASLGAEMHAFAIEKILPRVARVRSTAAIIAACGAPDDL
jgi:nicotinamidase-related amidase